MKLQAVGKTKGNILQQFSKPLSASEALYGFGGWLTTRKEPTTMSSKHEAGPIAELIDIFCETNKLEEPRENWDKHFKQPKE